MGVKGAKNKKEQDKWNKFVSSLVQHAGLPATSLVRLTFTDSKGKYYEINNYDDLTQLSTQHGIQTATHHLQMHIDIHVLALTFTDYQQRFKYEQDLFMTHNNIKLPKSTALTDAQKQILSKFVLSPLISTKAVIQKATKAKKPPINIMDMLNVNENVAPKPVEKGTNAVLNDILDNVVEPKPEPKPKPKHKPKSPAVSSNKHHPKTSSQLSTIFDLPLVSFEELRCEHYRNQKKWKQSQQTKIVILNWPQTMNRDMLRTMFTAYGSIIEYDVNQDNHCGFVQYDTNTSAQNAIDALDGFKMGDSKLTVQFLRFEPQPEVEQKEPLKEEKSTGEDTRLVIGNWPPSMSRDLLCTLFAPYGEISEAKIVNECAFIEYKTKSEAQKAHSALNGFQMGSNKLTITFTANEISHILNMDQDTNPPSDPVASPEAPDIAAEPDEFQHIEYPPNEENKPLEPDPVSIFEAQDIEPLQEPNELQLKSTESDKKTPNETDIAQMVLKESEKEVKKKEDGTDSSDSDSDSSSNSYSDDSSLDSTDSLHKLKRKNSKKKLSKRQLRKLKKKQRKRKRRKMKEKKQRKKMEDRQKYVDRNITALNDCMEKFTTLMSSVSQSAMIMQQSVAQISQMHAQQQQQSMVYQQSMQSLFPNQPMYASIIPTASTSAAQQPGTQPTGNNSESMQKMINEMSNTQGGPEDKTKEETPKMNAMNTDILNQQLMEQQQQLVQQQMRLAQNKANASKWVNSNFPKPTISTKPAQCIQASDMNSSPILHSTHHASPRAQNSTSHNELNLMHLSGDSEPGNNPSKSKIFEHKKALRNVSKEMDQKLTQLNNMGYKNRTFNLVLLKQENGDMEKVVAALKQFYQSN